METTASISITASARLHAAFAAVRALDLPGTAAGLLRAGLDVAQIVRSLDADDDVVIAALLQPLLDAGLMDREAAEKRFGADAVRLARNLSQLGEFGFVTGWGAPTRPRGRSGRGAAQDAAGRHRRCALGGGAPRRATAENARRQIARSRPAAQARDR